ncbi:hypothetical protein NZD89_09190 [Alicyclobacillus fastidiosus]|uniref:PARP-type domain-containing protein n=1 Tax=Alicyclobacillus fastidiosus TaxID=392011 RepID=A0ABY6ZLR2_9BACL|nr:hypothetical protein [Alicyclobacillus fastidiosus]WAH43533.1 hypothetical protein NZD89_09190 [Alicyclobacillus fastidiosus]GMA59702.1 hypothetical protein GCM10025859_01420 [Alicyclobacillus fastidiosus]GMA65552.1 hypothetical protein GCM10025859_59920 [Alicyclobacillus fastidiosus]
MKVCRVCGEDVDETEPHQLDFVSGWMYHVDCLLPESEKRRDEE